MRLCELLSRHMLGRFGVGSVEGCCGDSCSGGGGGGGGGFERFLNRCRYISLALAMRYARRLSGDIV